MEENEKRVAIESCSSCKYYQSEIIEDDDVVFESDLGYCRRFPPHKRESALGIFPLVEHDNWCGEYQKNPNE